MKFSTQTPKNSSFSLLTLRISTLKSKIRKGYQVRQPIQSHQFQSSRLEQMSFLHNHDHDDECSYPFTLTSVPIDVIDHDLDHPYFPALRMQCDCCVDDDEDEDEMNSDNGSSVMSECQCESCRAKGRYIKRSHIYQSGKDEGKMKKRFEALQASIKNFIEQESKKQTSVNSATDEITRQETNLKLLQAKVKSQELEVLILHLNAKEIKFNAQMIKNAMKVSWASIPSKSHVQPWKKNEEDIRTVHV